MPLKTQGLQFQYNEANRFEFPDLHINQGEHQLILGQSGRGKTTFLHLLAGILTPASGSVFVNNTDITSLSSGNLDRFRGKYIGLVFQRSYFVKSLSVKDNLLLSQKLAGKKENLQEIQQVLEELNIPVKLASMPNELSIGEQQRVSIARAVINNPAVILADEPTSALDDENAEKVADLLEGSAENHKANLVVVTHDQRLKNRFKNVLTL